jgi:hypothetical protein
MFGGFHASTEGVKTRYGRNTSMAADKKDYQTVLGALVDYGTLASIINKLNRVFIATEDTDLKKLIEPVVARIDKVLRDLPSGKKSVRASCRQQLKVEPFKSVVEYCQKCIGSTKPQWQIIAEHHGWGPKIK